MTDNPTSPTTLASTRDRAAHDLAVAQQRRAVAATALRAHDKTFGEAGRIIAEKRADKAARLKKYDQEVADLEQTVADLDAQLAGTADHGETA